MKIKHDDRRKLGLKITDTTPGQVYFYDTYEVYVIRVAAGPIKFVGLDNGDTYEGADGHLFYADTELVIR